MYDRMKQSEPGPALRFSFAEKLAAAMNKPQDMCCTLCGHRWVGSATSCPNCHGLAKSDGEVTKKTFQDDNDLKKGLR